MKCNRKSIFTLFLCSIILRSVLGLWAGQNRIFMDELIHIRLVHNLFSNGLSMVRGVVIEKADFVYYLFLSPALLFKDAMTARNAMVILNAVMISFSLIPAGYLASKLCRTQTCWWLYMAVIFTLPEMTYSMHILQENLFLPLFFSYCAVLYALVEKQETRSLQYGVVLGILAALMIHTKDSGILLFVCTLLVMLFFRISGKNIVAFFASTVLINWLANLWYGEVLTKSQQHMDAMTLIRGIGENSKFVPQKSLIFGYNIQKAFYLLTEQGIEFLLMFLVYIAIFLLVGMGVWCLAGAGAVKQWSKSERALFCFGQLSTFVVMSATIVLQIDEMSGWLSGVRFHYRYLFYYGVLNCLFFLVMWERRQFHPLPFGIGAMLAVLVSLFSNILPQNTSHVDCLETYYLEKKIITDWQYYALAGIILVLVLWLWVLLCKKKWNTLLAVVCVISVGYSCFISAHSYIFGYYQKASQAKFLEDARLVDQYIDSSKVTVVAAVTHAHGSAMESYLTSDSYATTLDDLRVWLEAGLEQEQQELVVYSTGRIYSSGQAATADYILSEEKMDADKMEALGYSEIALGLHMHYLYEKKN